MTQAEKLIVKAADYNGHRDVLFMMDADDPRLTMKGFSHNYTRIGGGRFDAKAKVFTTNDGARYEVFRDRSARAA